MPFKDGTGRGKFTTINDGIQFRERKQQPGSRSGGSAFGLVEHQTFKFFQRISKARIAASALKESPALRLEVERLLEQDERRSGVGRGSGAAAGQGSFLEGTSRWRENNHDAECGPDPGPGRATGRPHGQIRGPASGGPALQADLTESGSILLVEERQASGGHRDRRPRHRPHHHPAGHRSDPHQLACASYNQPHQQALKHMRIHKGCTYRCNEIIDTFLLYSILSNVDSIQSLLSGETTEW